MRDSVQRRGTLDGRDWVDLKSYERLELKLKRTRHALHQMEAVERLEAIPNNPDLEQRVERLESFERLGRRDIQDVNADLKKFIDALLKVRRWLTLTGGSPDELQAIRDIVDGALRHDPS